MPLTTTANRTPPLIATLTGPAFTVPDPSAPLFQRPGVGKNAPAKVSSPPIVNFVPEPKASASSTVLTNHNSVTMPFIAASPPGSSGAMTSPRLDHSHNFGMRSVSKVTDGFGPRGQDSSGQSATRGGTNSDPTFFGKEKSRLRGRGLISSGCSSSFLDGQPLVAQDDRWRASLLVDREAVNAVIARIGHGHLGDVIDLRRDDRARVVAVVVREVDIGLGALLFEQGDQFSNFH